MSIENPTPTVAVRFTKHEARAVAYACEFTREVFVHEWGNMGIREDSLALAHLKLLGALERVGA